MVGGLIGGAAAVVATPVVLGAAGFTAAGVAAGSVGAAMMSYGPAVPGGAAVVGALQSAGAVGAGWKIATAGAAAGRKIAKAVVDVLS